ncbi:MAG TPA: NAD-dependent malic enzyme [Acidimicrobiia bacterium]|nr:NAD-dependent malic enzyme [Acidimicrobiia bacterium]
MKYRIERGPNSEWIMADVWKRGAGILTDALFNKGTAFTKEERQLFELDGMLPHQVTDRRRQVSRAWDHLQAKGDDPLEKYVCMASLQSRNETLYFQVLSEHIEELTPIVYTPTVGQAAVSYSHVFRRGRGLWITPDHRGRMYDILGHVRNEDVRLIVVTDNERILGLGDQGVGGMVIPIGKLALYTLGAGIHPAYTLPISLDVGTDNDDLLNEDLYAGWREPRLRGEPYYEFVDEFVDAVRRRFPEVVLQWEDFLKANAFVLLDRYRSVLPSFNDDIQGTGAAATAGINAACQRTGIKLADQRILMVGAGAAGVGIARHVRHAMAAAGVPDGEIPDHLALFDVIGLVHMGSDGLETHQHSVAWPAALAEARGLAGEASKDLVHVIDTFQPTILVGATASPGLFTEEAIRTMATHAERPVVMALSNPTSKCEAVPTDVLRWTEGRAIVATGSPFDPVELDGIRHTISQSNNIYIFPGVGMGALVSKAREVTDSMFVAASDALAAWTIEKDPHGDGLYPPLRDLRAITRAIAAAVVREARDAGVGRDISDDEIERELDHEIWNFDYPTLRPV